MRLIDADKIDYYKVERNGMELYMVWKGHIDNMPTIDAVPVVRCKDCKHRQAKMGDCYGNGVVLCKDGVWRDMEFFCADVERSEE